MKGFMDRKRQLGEGERFMGEKYVSDRRRQLQNTRMFILQLEGEAPGEF